jgi:general secretion pathway protein L
LERVVKALEFANNAYDRWLQAVGHAAMQTAEGFSPTPTQRLIEVRRGEFAFADGDAESAEAEPFRLDATAKLSASAAERLRGKRIEVVLMPEQAVCRPITLPSKASEYIDGIVRAQIDRLAPWNADQAVYGWTIIPDKSEQITVLVAVTSRALINPHLQALQSVGARSVAFTVAVPDEGVGQIAIFERQVDGVSTVTHVRNGLNRAFKIAAAAAAFTVVGSMLVDEWFGYERADLLQRTAEVQKSTRVVATGDVSDGAAQLLRRKTVGPAVTMIVEGLSNVLPDQTYVTELRWDGDRLRLIGITKDAAELVNLLERSGLFTQATFFAPTVRTDGGERYHIQVMAQPRSLIRS